MRDDSPLLVERLMQKWNRTSRRYEPYSIPEAWSCPLLTDLDQLVNCADCGRELTHGKCYTSELIHNLYGFGFGVCGGCYDAELAGEVQR